MEGGNFSHVECTLVDSMSNLSIDDVVNDNWCLNSGAFHHMTPTLDQFYDTQPYIGITSIIIGDGKTLKITHIGTIKLKTPSCLIDLKNVLFVPLIKKNLISIQCLCRDMKCDFVFYKMTKRKLLNGNITRELYHLRQV